MTLNNVIVTEKKGTKFIEYREPLNYQGHTGIEDMKALLFFARNTLADYADINPESIKIQGYNGDITNARTKRDRFNYGITYKDSNGKKAKGSLVYTYHNDLIVITNEYHIIQPLIV